MRIYYAGNGGRMEELMADHEPVPTTRWGVLVSYLDIQPSRWKRLRRQKKWFNKHHRKPAKK